eukprot:TRINITY_DN8077_c3_g1_i1.p1 TRINITY_DN8077_c3_g1~~TRINITY_DN8077_c3_g1_i1.p1  ORF type:complete len:366 (-),score=70.86 TRINITY_DN8077_c3_g1_i1:103-1077(-)
MAGNVERPPPLSREGPKASPEQLRRLPPGEVVRVRPARGESAPTMLAEVIGPIINMGSTGGAASLPPELQDKAWVRYFEPPSFGSRGRIRTEMVERQRLEVTIGSAAAGASYEAAMRVASSSSREPRQSLSQHRRSETSSSTGYLLSLGYQAHQAEASLALTNGNASQAAAMLRLLVGRNPGIIDSIDDDEALPSGVGLRPRSIIFSSLGVPLVSSAEEAPHLPSMPKPAKSAAQVWASMSNAQRSAGTVYSSSQSHPSQKVNKAVVADRAPTIPPEVNTDRSGEIFGSFFRMIGLGGNAADGHSEPPQELHRSHRIASLVGGA